MQWFDYIKLKQFKEKILSEDIGLKKNNNSFHKNVQMWYFYANMLFV